MPVGQTSTGSLLGHYREFGLRQTNTAFYLGDKTPFALQHHTLYDATNSSQSNWAPIKSQANPLELGDWAYRLVLNKKSYDGDEESHKVPWTPNFVVCRGKYHRGFKDWRDKQQQAEEQEEVVVGSAICAPGMEWVVDGEVQGREFRFVNLIKRSKWIETVNLDGNADKMWESRRGWLLWMPGDRFISARLYDVYGRELAQVEWNHSEVRFSVRKEIAHDLDTLDEIVTTGLARTAVIMKWQARQEVMRKEHQANSH